MIKQIFSLMLSASILAISPVCAMQDDPNETPSKTLRKFEITKECGESGRGALNKLVTDLFFLVLDRAPVNEGLKVFQLSKSIYNLCNQETVWKIFAKKHNCILDPKSPVLARSALKEFLSLFANKDKSYKIKIAVLQSFKNTPYTDPMCSNSYVFSLGKNRFQLKNNLTGPDRLEVLDQDAYTTFSWNTMGDGFFEAHVSVGKHSPGIKDLNSQEYISLMGQDFSGSALNNYCDLYASNRFIITNLKD